MGPSCLEVVILNPYGTLSSSKWLAFKPNCEWLSWEPQNWSGTSKLPNRRRRAIADDISYTSTHVLHLNGSSTCSHRRIWFPFQTWLHSLLLGISVCVCVWADNIVGNQRTDWFVRCYSLSVDLTGWNEAGWPWKPVRKIVLRTADGLI